MDRIGLGTEKTVNVLDSARLPRPTSQVTVLYLERRREKWVACSREEEQLSAITMEELIQTGLCDGSIEHHLTLRGRDMLRRLEDLETQEVVDQNEAAADLVLSTNGIFR